MEQYDFIIVGSGLFGSTFAYKAKSQGKRCLIIERRSNFGGNVYCENVEGINVHKYGAHIFHTSNKSVWDFVNSFVPFNRYTNSPVANYKGHIFNLPFNMNTFYQMWGVSSPEEAEMILSQQRRSALESLQGNEPRNLEEQAILLVGYDIYERLIKDYTEKQWGRSCKELPPFIIKRLPVRMVFDNNYFNDRYQGVPEGGYNKLISGLIEGIDCRLDTDFFTSVAPETGETYAKSWRRMAKQLVYTGPVDQYFGYKYGHLDWRTVEFKTKVLGMPNYQGNAVVNYTSHDQPYTRVIEHKHFECFGQDVYSIPKTVVSEEYSVEYKMGMEPYYPINDAKNSAIAEKYHYLSEREEDVIFGGRLADYKYYDMAPVIEKALSIEI